MQRQGRPRGGQGKGLGHRESGGGERGRTSEKEGAPSTLRRETSILNEASETSRKGGKGHDPREPQLCHAPSLPSNPSLSLSSEMPPYLPRLPLPRQSENNSPLWIAPRYSRGGKGVPPESKTQGFLSHGALDLGMDKARPRAWPCCPFPKPCGLQEEALDAPLPVLHGASCPGPSSGGLEEPLCLRSKYRLCRGPVFFLFDR